MQLRDHSPKYNTYLNISIPVDVSTIFYTSTVPEVIADNLKLTLIKLSYTSVLFMLDTAVNRSGTTEIFTLPL